MFGGSWQPFRVLAAVNLEAILFLAMLPGYREEFVEKIVRTALLFSAYLPVSPPAPETQTLHAHEGSDPNQRRLGRA
jgi:hypothetical protein